MPVMLVVCMPVLVLHSGVAVLVLMPFGQVQPEAHGHEATGDQKSQR
jgi:hypothetical protein